MVLSNVRVALRMLRRAPWVTIPAIVVLTLGIGTATALYAIVYSKWLRPLPYPDSAKLVSVLVRYPTYKLDALASPDYGEWQDTRSLGPLAAYTVGTSALIGTEDTIEVGRARISGNLQDVLKVHVAMGRDIQPSDDNPGATKVALVADGVWRDRFGGDPRAIGRSVVLDGESHTIIGVLHRSFRMPEQQRIDFVTPLAIEPRFLRHGAGSAKILKGMARLQSGVTVDGANAELSARLARSRALEPALYEEHASMRIVPLNQYAAGDQRTAGIVLIGAVASILLIASANVAGLLVARAAGRAREMAIRTALGASRFRIIEQLATEGLLIGVSGIGAGLLLARAFVEINSEVLAIAVPVLLACVLGFSMMPAVAMPRVRLRRLLVIGELALSLMLLIGAALMLESLARLRSVSPGFLTDRVITASMTLKGTHYAQRDEEFRRELRERLERMPGAIAVSFADALPPKDSSRITMYKNDAIVVRLVDERFFNAMGIGLLRGRLFNAADQDVMVVNRTLADRYLQSDTEHWKNVVGVVADIKNDGLRNPTRPEMYLPLTKQNKSQAGGVTHDNGLRVVIRTAGDPAAVSNALRRSLHDLDPALLANIRGMDEQWAELSAAPRFQAMTLTGFAALALIMAGVGVYGVLSHVVVLRRREMGIRLALGATAANVQGLVIREALILAGTGAAIGVAGANAGSRLLASMLFEVRPRDPATLAVSAGLLVLLAVLSSAGPARSAARQDPARTLRAE